MKITRIYLLCCCCIAISGAAFSQERFNDCTAAFLNKKMVVDEYSPTGKCVLAHNATGELTVCTVNLSPDSAVPVKQLPFKIALRDGSSKTLVMYDEKTFKTVDIQKLLAKCKLGDSIVLITLDNQYAFPHHEILIK